jgi:alpha-methylacyl-CoA racemase
MVCLQMTLGQERKMGPLSSIKIVEFAGLGAAPFCAMMLADMGAEVIRIDRADARGEGGRFDILNRGRRSIALDLKKPAAVAAVLRLTERAHILLEGFRPGVMERLGLGPDVCMAHNPRLIYGRMTGWGQEGPLSRTAGHDINYISLAGVLDAIGPAGAKPVPPLNLVGDYAGGMMMAFGLVCALVEAEKSGSGQVVDGAMIDAAALTMNRFLGLYAEGSWHLERGTNYLDGGAPFYDTYLCADDKAIAIGPIEPRFFALLISKLGVDLDPALQQDRARWTSQKARLAEIFRQRTRDEWCALLEKSDVCFSPVLSLHEAPAHPHNRARDTFIEVEGIVQAAPAPRFSRTHPEISRPPPVAGAHDNAILRDWGFTIADIESLKKDGAFGTSDEKEDLT